jgi:hypothetical protein
MRNGTGKKQQRIGIALVTACATGLTALWSVEGRNSREGEAAADSSANVGELAGRARTRLADALSTITYSVTKAPARAVTDEARRADGDDRATAPVALALAGAAAPPAQQPHDPFMDLARLDTVRTMEGRDDAWSDAMEAGIMDALKFDTFRGTEVREIACSKTLCRVEVDHVDTEAGEAFDDDFADLSPSHGSSFVVPLGNRTNTLEDVMRSQDS